MDYQTLFCPESRFGGFSDVDGTIAFAERVRALLYAEDSVLDVGCGRGAISDDPIARQHELVVLRGKVAKVVGIDVDPSASANPFIDEFHLIGENQKWPLNNQSINLCVCDSVLEHVQDPARFLSEVQRVINPGATFAFARPTCSAISVFSPGSSPASSTPRSPRVSSRTAKRKTDFPPSTAAAPSGNSNATSLATVSTPSFMDTKPSLLIAPSPWSPMHWLRFTKKRPPPSSRPRFLPLPSASATSV